MHQPHLLILAFTAALCMGLSGTGGARNPSAPAPRARAGPAPDPSPPASPAPEPSALLFSEILYEPDAGRGQREYLEVFNAGNEPVHLEGLRLIISQPGARPDTTDLTAPVWLPPGGVAVWVNPARKADVPFLYDDLLAAFPSMQGALQRDLVLPLERSRSLPDDGFIAVLELRGLTVDSLLVTPDLHHPAVANTRGRSLVRIDPSAPATIFSNWTTSPEVEGGSPGRYSPQWMGTVPRGGLLTITPTLGDPRGGESFRIDFSPSASPFVARVEIFDLRGRSVLVVAAAIPASSPVTVFWNGRDDSGLSVAPGPYVVFAQAYSAARKEVGRSVVVVAR